MQKHPFTIYNASAGSGKTYTLVKEYLKILLQSNKPDAYRNILAITFTNKAVQEMKSRVVESLSEFAKDNPSDKALRLMQDINGETGISLPKITEKSRSIIKNLIHNYASFDISTIDKFTHKVIRAFAHDLNLPITFEVSLDTESLLNEAIDAIIAQAGEDAELTDLLVNYTMEKTDDDKSWDISGEIFGTGKLILNENNREEITHFKEKTIQDFIAIKEKLVKLCEDLQEESADLAQQALDLIDSKGIDLKSFSRGTFPNHLQSICDGKFNSKNKMFYEFEDIAINKTAKDKGLIEVIIPDLLNILAEVYRNFEKQAFYEAFLKNITPLSLLNTISNELSRIQTEQNTLSISEFNKLIHEQIQNQPAPFIYERLGEKYRNFFIDEFQDTSEMQWQNLIPLIGNALSGQDEEGRQGRLMLVGDPKQSIYRWRGGKAEQFIGLSKNDNPFPNVDKFVDSLKTNYRSYSQIIEFNNDFFRFLSAKFEDEDYRDLYEKNSHQKTNDKRGGYVNISFIPDIEDSDVETEEESLTKNDLYFEATLQTIEKVRSKGFEYRDIVFLVRKNSQGTTIANYLTEKGIPILSSESLLLGASTEVKVVVNVLQYLNNASDLEAKAYFLYYFANRQEQLPVHDFIAQGIKKENEPELQFWLQQSCDIDFSFDALRKKSLYEATEMIVSRMIPAGKQNAYVQFFLDVVFEHDYKKQAGISEFLNYWETHSSKLSIPTPEGNDAVRIMSIHKSKGLEFPVVIFPFAEEDYSRGPREKMWLSADEEEMGLPKVLVDKSSSVEGYGEDAFNTYHLRKQEELLDDINVLYVALTRAEEQLYVISSQMKMNKQGNYPNNLATYFIEFIEENGGFAEDSTEYEWGSGERKSVLETKIDTSRVVPQVTATLDTSKIKIAQRESLMWNTKQQQAIEYGNIIHEILSYVKTQNDVELAITKAVENGLIVVEKRETVLRTINEIVNHKELESFFFGNIKVLNEKTIIQKEGNLVKPDRMVMNGKEVYLLDYKTGAHLPKYRQQLENYQQAIEKMGYKVSKKVLVYIGESLEVVNL